MKKPLIILLSIVTAILSSCSQPVKNSKPVITVSIPPLAWFVEGIAGDDYAVNVMLPPAADHHIWEPLPAQITALAGSKALVINGQLGFEEAWMARFREVNPEMKILDASDKINLIEYAGSEHGDDHGEEEDGHAGHIHEGADPHYWMSPQAAYTIADNVLTFLSGLNPSSAEKYRSNHEVLVRRINETDSLLRESLKRSGVKTFMIFHPALGYMARDYGLEQVTFEDEGKSPSPARLKELIDTAREKKIGIIFIQAEYDTRNAASISEETGARLVVINPMNRDWPAAVNEVAATLGGN